MGVRSIVTQPPAQTWTAGMAGGQPQVQSIVTREVRFDQLIVQSIVTREVRFDQLIV